MRFPGFTEEWRKDILQNVVTFSNGKAHENCVDENGSYILVNSKFVSTDGSVVKKVTSQLSPLSKSQFVMVMSDLPNGKALAKCYYIEEDNIYTLNQRICSFSAKNGNISRFLMYQINRNKYYLRFDDGINQTNLKKGEVLACPVFIPSVEEQKKIATFIHLLDERIATQNKIIEKLETLIKGIRDYVLNNKLQNTTKKKLGELCTITTGKLDANAMKSEGLYPFFTCAEEVYRIDSFAFDTEALLVSGNGANLGYIHYYKGKFNAYQRTYVLSNFIEDIHYIQIYLEAYLHKRIALEKSTSNTPYIVLATLAEMPIIIPNIKIQKDISNKILILKSKLITEIHIRNCYKDMRQFLLSQMFI